MSSNDFSDQTPLVLSPQQFEVIFQVTHQLSNFQESRLEALGCTQEDLDLLLATLALIRDRAESASKVRIDFYEGDDECAGNAVLESGAGHATEVEARGILPRRFAAVWSSLAELVITALSQRELFLRIGYHFDEIRDAVTKLGEIL
jgi:hypothetical protein